MNVWLAHLLAGNAWQTLPQLNATAASVFTLAASHASMHAGICLYLASWTLEAALTMVTSIDTDQRQVAARLQVMHCAISL